MSESTSFWSAIRGLQRYCIRFIDRGKSHEKLLLPYIARCLYKRFPGKSSNMDITQEVYRIAYVPTEDAMGIQEICHFRAKVWHATLLQDGRRFAGHEIRDSWDNQATHWVMRDAFGQIAASGRLIVALDWNGIPEPSEYHGKGIPEVRGLIAAPDRIVVRPDCQKVGLASRLLELQEREAERLGAEIAVRQASPGMLRSVEKRGWVSVGPANPDPKFPDVPFTVAYKLLRPLFGDRL